MSNSVARRRVAVIVGSLRRESINRKIANSIISMTTRKLDCSIVEIGDLAPYNEDREAEGSRGYESFRSQVGVAEAVLFCTPEYNRGVPGQLKNAIDVGSRAYGQSVWSRKPAAIVSASPGSIGGFGANHQLRQYCTFLDMPLMQQPEAYLGGVTADKFDDEGLLAAGQLRDVVANIASAYETWVDLILGDVQRPPIREASAA